MQGFTVFVAVLALAAAAPVSEGPLVQLIVNVNAGQSAGPGPAVTPIVAEDSIAADAVIDAVVDPVIVVDEAINEQPEVIIPEPVVVVENSPEPIQVAQPIFPGVIAPVIVTPDVNPIDVIAVGAPEINPIDVIAVGAPEINPIDVIAVGAPEINPIDVIAVGAPEINPIDVIAVGAPEINPIDVVAVGAPEINPIDILHPVVVPVAAGAIEGIIV